MSEWKKVKIGDIFSIEKGSLQSSKNIAGKYNFITAASEWKTHDSYDHDCEAIVYAVAASGSLGRAHYVSGKFIASDLCFILTEKDKNKYPINFLFYQIVFEMMREEIVSKTKTGTSKESINRGNFSNYEIPYFSIDFQMANYQRFVDAKNTIKLLNEESEKQKSYAKLLRQNILQDAIEGKLTADWRKTHPVIKGNPDYDAEALLEKIREEKCHSDSILLTQNQKKRKNGKSLDFQNPCDNEDLPFEIPGGWKWVRLGEISISSMAGKSFACEGRTVTANEWGIIKTSAITSGIFIESENKFYSETKPNDIFTKINIGDFLFCRASGSKGLAGKSCIVEKINSNLLLSDKSIRIKLYSNIKTHYINMLNNSFYGDNYRLSLGTNKSTTMNNLTRDQILNFLIPLPPLEEQTEIVNQIEKHLKTVSDLENQVTEREQLTKQLMQSILKDAFEEK